MIEIPEQELEEEFFRPACGPGGQHLNKTSNGVRLHWSASASSLLLSETQIARLRKLAGPAWQDGSIVLPEHASRSLTKNRETARQRLADLVERALPEPKKRKKTKATRASQERRLKKKSIRSQIKRMRSGRTED